MKILILASFANSLIAFRGDLIQAIVKKGHTVLACAPDAFIEGQHSLAAMGVNYQQIVLKRTGLNPANDLRTLVNLWSLFHTYQPSIVLSYTIKPVVYGSIAGKLAHIPRTYAMITGLGYAFAGSTLTSRWVNRIVRILYRISLPYNHKVFFQNSDDLQLFLQSKFIHQQQAVLINGSGVDLDMFRPTPFPEALTFLLVGRLLQEKGVREYVEAARCIKQAHPHVIFRLVGWIDPGNPASVSEHELASWVQEGIIEYHGKVPDVRPILAASSIYVLPSYREGMPRSILEAMAMGRPIITTDAPGCRETVSDGENGFLVPVKDVAALAAAMERFIQHPELIEPMGQASRRIAIKKYDVRQVNAVILKTMGLD